LSYDLFGVDGSNACLVMLDQCLADPRMPPNGPEACEPSTTLYDDGCESVARCGPTADLGGGATALSVERIDRAGCYDGDPDDGGVSCSCLGNGNDLQFFLEGATAETGCELAFDLCQTGEPDYSTPGDCAEPYVVNFASECSLAVPCTLSSEIAPGVSARVDDFRSVGCLQLESSWVCNCDVARYFRVRTDLEPVDVCEQGYDLCMRIDDIPVAEGPLDCEVEFLGSYADGASQSCELTEHCGVWTVVDDVEIAVTQELTLVCYRDDEGDYTCECVTADASSSFQFAADFSHEETCIAAEDQCRGMLL
jgi:hypothetical protein